MVIGRIKTLSSNILSRNLKTYCFNNPRIPYIYLHMLYQAAITVPQGTMKSNPQQRWRGKKKKSFQVRWSERATKLCSTRADQSDRLSSFRIINDPACPAACALNLPFPSLAFSSAEVLYIRMASVQCARGVGRLRAVCGSCANKKATALYIHSRGGVNDCGRGRYVINGSCRYLLEVILKDRRCGGVWVGSRWCNVGIDIPAWIDLDYCCSAGIFFNLKKCWAFFLWETYLLMEKVGNRVRRDVE